MQSAPHLPRSRRHRFAGPIALATVLGLTSIVCACNVPVFRFALERWRPDPFRVVLFQSGPLSAADLEAIRPLEEAEAKFLANLSLRTVDVHDFEKPVADGDDLARLDRLMFAAQGDKPLPRLVVLYPDHLRIAKPVWSGSPSRESIASLLDSPVRQELIKRLAAGQTAVWLLVEPGLASGVREHPDGVNAAQSHREADASRSPIVALLEAELKKLEHELKLPELTTAPEDALLANTPLRVGFSLLRIRRDDPAEQALVAMLIGSEPDLAERSDPMVFPVFGRGRALLPLIGAGITAKNIHDSAEFLVGPCSCEVKELNPGFDLLLLTDWDKQLTADGTPLPTPVAAQPIGPPVLVPIPAGGAANPAPGAVAQYSAPVVVSHTYAFTPVLAIVVLGGSLVAALVVVALVAALSSSRGRSET